MRWPWRRRAAHGVVRPASAADTEHLTEFVRTRRGVEAYLEPRTAVTETTVVLVAATGEWTRRRVPSAETADKFARKHGIPLYDAAKLGYPQRMREWTRTHARGAENDTPGLGTSSP